MFFVLADLILLNHELPDLTLTGALDMERAYLAGYALWAEAGT